MVPAASFAWRRKWRSRTRNLCGNLCNAGHEGYLNMYYIFGSIVCEFLNEKYNQRITLWTALRDGVLRNRITMWKRWHGKEARPRSRSKTARPQCRQTDTQVLFRENQDRTSQGRKKKPTWILLRCVVTQCVHALCFAENGGTLFGTARHSFILPLFAPLSTLSHLFLFFFSLLPL